MCGCDGYFWVTGCFRDFPALCIDIIFGPVYTLFEMLLFDVICIGLHSELPLKSPDVSSYNTVDMSLGNKIVLRFFCIQTWLWLSKTSMYKSSLHVYKYSAV